MTETHFPDTVPATQELPVRLRFTGSGAEYFRIWAVNLTLTILTLGLYSAWAKVRRLQYFYRNTELDGAVFDYTASPLSILLGRVFALVMLLVYYVAFQFSAVLGAAVTAVLALALPFLLWQSNRFKARNTWYRGLSFGFGGSVGDAYRVYLPAIVILFGPTVLLSLWPDAGAESVAVLLSLGAFLLLPVLHAMYRRYLQANLRYGDTRFDFSATAGDFAAVWAWGLGVMVVSAIAMIMLMLLAGGLSVVLADKGRFAEILAVLAFFFAAWVSYLMVGSFLSARFQTLIWGKTRIGTLEVSSDISAVKLLKLQTVNTVLIVATLGVYRPFAAIRLTRYRLECIAALHLESLASVHAGAASGKAGATGEGAAEFFELDIGL